MFGYTSEVCDYASRVDDELLMVESFGLADNLMLEGPMLRRELAVVRVVEHGPSLTAAFAAFELTVRLAAAELGAEPTRPAPSP